jgi:RNA 3'-phosphate cyclase
MGEPIEISADFGEGGGAILRVAAGLAATTRRQLKITNIRKNRPNPGLRTQHMMGIKAIADLTNGTTTPLAVGTTELELTPGSGWNPQLTVPIATAGNIGLLTQTLHNALYTAPAQSYTIQVNGGGTFGMAAPSPVYLNNVSFRIMEKMGYHVHIEVQKHGYYPKGGAAAKIEIQPSANGYCAFDCIDRGEITGVYGEIHVHTQLQQGKVGERIASSLEKQIKKMIPEGMIPQIRVEYHDSLSVGVGVDAWAEFSSGTRLGTGTMLGERKVSSEEVGRRCADRISHILHSKATVDEYASDQILPLMCLAKGSSRILVESVSSHCSTNIQLLKYFFNRPYRLEKGDGGTIITYE